MNEELCQVQVPEGARSMQFHVCGRPIKRDGMCGMHAAAKERREDADLRWREDHTNQRALAAHLKEELATLGIPGEAYYSPLSRKYDNRVVVTIEDLQKFVREVQPIDRDKMRRVITVAADMNRIRLHDQEGQILADAVLEAVRGVQS